MKNQCFHSSSLLESEKKTRHSQGFLMNHPMVNSVRDGRRRAGEFSVTGVTSECVAFWVLKPIIGT